MKMDKVANSGNDEYYTPEYAITPLFKYLPTSHIKNGQNFFEIDPPKCDYIISNPPYSLKSEVFNRLFQLSVPFAMLVGVVGLFESQKRFEIFRDHNFEIMYFNRRISYFKDYVERKPSINPPFSSVYVCSGLLTKQIVFEEIEKT